MKRKHVLIVTTVLATVLATGSVFAKRSWSSAEQPDAPANTASTTSIWQAADNSGVSFSTLLTAVRDNHGRIVFKSHRAASRFVNALGIDNATISWVGKGFYDIDVDSADDDGDHETLVTYLDSDKIEDSIYEDLSYAGATPAFPTKEDVEEFLKDLPQLQLALVDDAIALEGNTQWYAVTMQTS